MLTLSSKLWIFLSFSSLSHLNSLKDVVLNQNSKKIKGPYQFPLDPLYGINSPLFLKFVPLSKKLLVKSFDLVSFNNHFLSLPITQVRVYYSHMLVKIHQFSSMNGGEVRLRRGDVAGAQKHFEEALEANEGLGNKRGEAYYFTSLAAVARMRGDAVTARKLHEDALQIRRDINEKTNIRLQIWDTVPPILYRPDNKSSSPSPDPTTEAPSVPS